MKKYLFFIISLFFGPLLWAQPHYAQVLETLEQESPTFLLLRQQKEALQAAAQAGSLVEDPEVEFAFFWHSPNDNQGNRWDLKVTQQLEMPSVYLHKNKIRQLQRASAESHWRLHRQQLLLEAQQVCAALVFNNANVIFYSRCEQLAQAVAQLYQKRLESGDCGVLDYNRAQMELAEVRNKLNLARVERDAMMDNLTLLNGGTHIAFSDSSFPEVLLPDDFELWYREAQQQSPQLQYLQNQLQQSEQQLALTRSQWLPKFSVGYASENTVPESFRGVALGLNVPLWSKARTVNHAKIELQAAHQERDNAMKQYYNHLKALFNKTRALNQNYRNLQQTFLSYNSEQLLLKALDAGEISLEYFLQSAHFYHDAEASLLEVRYALEQAFLQLNADAL